MTNIVPVHATIALQAQQICGDRVQQTLTEQPSLPLLPDAYDSIDSERPKLDSFVVAQSLSVVLEITNFSI